MNIDILQNISLFSAVKKSELEKLLADNHIYKKHYSKGVTVHNANETCRTLDIVLSGSLVAYSLSTNGSSTTMFEFSKGSVIEQIYYLVKTTVILLISIVLLIVKLSTLT